MNKLETIYTQIERIRTALGMDCSSIEEVADAVEAMANDTSRSGLTTVFVFSNSGYNKPTATTMNMRTGEVEDLDEE